MFLLPDYRVRQRDYLLDISRALTSKLDVVEVLRMILQAAASMLSGEVALIALREGDTFRVRAVIGLAPEDARTFDGILRDLKPETAGEIDLTATSNLIRKAARTLDLNLRQIVALPMVMAGDMLGILFVFRAYAGTPTENDYRLLQSFADQAAIAVQNARIYEFSNQERRRLAAILDYSADGVMILDANLTVERWNRALSWMTGLRAELAQGRPHDVVIRWKQRTQGPDLREAIENGWPGESSADSPETLYVEGDLERVDGTTISVGITYAPLRRASGGLQNVIANVRDITHFREADQLKSTFISIVSHELKTPVALIKGYADTLRREDADWDRTTMLNGLRVIEEEADRLAELIENLLAASKLQAEGMRLTLDDVNLVTLVQQAIERFQTQTTKHTLSASFQEGFPIITGDHTRLRQVVDNLLSNAIKYSPNGGQITVRGTYDSQSVHVAVSDQGTGLPPDQLTRIFERFHRVDNALTNNTQGTGLGLYLAHAVITAHNGRIWAANNPDGGATFHFVLPRQANS